MPLIRAPGAQVRGNGLRNFQKSTAGSNPAPGTESSHPVTANPGGTAGHEVAAAPGLLFQVDGDVVKKTRGSVKSGGAGEIKETVLDCLKNGRRQGLPKTGVERKLTAETK